MSCCISLLTNCLGFTSCCFGGCVNCCVCNTEKRVELLADMYRAAKLDSYDEMKWVPKVDERSRLLPPPATQLNLFKLPPFEKNKNYGNSEKIVRNITAIFTRLLSNTASEDRLNLINSFVEKTDLYRAYPYGNTQKFACRMQLMECLAKTAFGDMPEQYKQAKARITRFSISSAAEYGRRLERQQKVDAESSQRWREEETKRREQEAKRREQEIEIRTRLIAAFEQQEAGKAAEEARRAVDPVYLLRQQEALLEAVNAQTRALNNLSCRW